MSNQLIEYTLTFNDIHSNVVITILSKFHCIAESIKVVGTE